MTEPAAITYARRLIEEADAYQVSNADCNFDDVDGMWDDLPEEERPDYNAWESSTIRERLWDYGCADEQLAVLTAQVRNLVEHYDGGGALVLDAPAGLQNQCWLLWDYLVADYGLEPDDELAAPPFPRPAL